MLKLNFIIHDKYLAYYTIKNTSSDAFINRKDKDYVISFQNYAWNKSKSLYDFLRFGPNSEDIINDSLKIKLEEIDEFLKNLVSSVEFQTIKKQTLDSLKKIEREWLINYEKSSEIIFELTGLTFDREFNVYITHPALRSGRNLRGDIFWSERNDWPNYNSVYLWHEILHNYFENNDLNHAIIELISDNELRIKLNGGTYPPLQGHKNLLKLKEELLSSWYTYLKTDKKDIRKFIEKIDLGRKRPKNFC